MECIYIVKKIDLSKLWPHQVKTYEFGINLPALADGSDPGCVDCDTEFLTPTGWKKISEYCEADEVAAIHPSTLALSFAKPIGYFEMGCSVMHHFAGSRGVDMMLSSEHRVLCYPRTGSDKLQRWEVCSAVEFKEKARFRDIAASFTIKKGSSIDLDNASIRVMVAVIADGHFPNKTNHCVVRLKKDRKKAGLRALLTAAKIPYQEKEYNERIKGFTVFTFQAPRREKEYTSYWWNASLEQLKVISCEALLWDGDQKNSFFTRSKLSADFIQYAFTVAGYVASVSEQERTSENGKAVIDYMVYRREKPSRFVGRIRPESIHRVRPKNSKKYCFTTSTGFWVARRNGHIFATGNSGKTIAHAKLAEHWLENENGSRIVIACPKTLMRSAWMQEFEKFMPDMEVALAEAPAETREEAFKSKAPIAVINVDGLKWLASQSKITLGKWLGPRAMLIVDESHTLKNPTAQRTKAALKIASYFKKRHIASGTMAPNSVVELWSQIKILDDGERLGKRFNAFRNLMQQPVNYGGFVNWVDKPDSPAIAYGLISDIMIRHSFAECMKHVPEMTEQVIYYELPKKHAKVYKELEKESYIEEKGKSITAINAASLANKLLQCASGAVYTDPDGTKDKSWVIIDAERYELIADLVEARKHSIVFWLWKHQREELKRILDGRHISYGTLDGDVKSGAVRDETVKKMQSGELRCLLMHPDTGAYGLTLTKATSVIYASPVYEAMKKKQGDARVRRGVQDQATESIVVVARGTRDVQAYSVFTGKRERLDALNNLFESGFDEQ